MTRPALSNTSEEIPMLNDDSPHTIDDVGGDLAPFDFVTVLRSEDVAPGKRIVLVEGQPRLAEQVEKEAAARENRKPAKPPHPTFHTATTHPLRADHLLDDLFAALSTAKHAYAIHGELRDKAKARNVRRRKALFDDARHAWLALDIDKLECDFADGESVAAFVRDRLPEEFRNRRCIWNLTPSHILKAGKSRVRLYFALDRALSLGETKNWLSHAAIGDGLAIDHALWNSRVQENFLRPALDRGVADPFPNRWGTLPGEIELVAVPTIDMSAAAAKSERRGLPAIPDVTIDDPEYIAYALPRLLAQRTIDRIESDGRQNTFRFLAQDLQDRAFSQDLAEAVALHFFFHSEETADALREMLGEKHVARADKLVAEVTALGESRDDVWLGREGVLDEEDILSQINQGYAGAQNGFGCKNLSSEDASADFSAVDDDEGDEPSGALDAWLESPSDLAAYEALMVEMTSRGIKRTAASQAIRGAQMGALMGVDDEAGVVALKALATAQTKAKPSRFAPLSMDEAIARSVAIKTPYLVKGLMNESGLSLIFAASGAGKTFVFLDLMFHVAAGKAWNGLRVKQAAVLYLAAEGGEITYRRLEALAKKRGGGDVQLYIETIAPDLVTSTKDRDALVALVRRFEGERGVKFKVIVVDTLSMALAGADEDAEGFGKAIAACKYLRQETGAHVGLVHHSGKVAAAGARGHSSLRAAVDLELEIKDGALVVTKNRDDVTGGEFPFHLERVVLRKDDEGDDVTSCVVNWTAAPQKSLAPTTPTEAEVLGVIAATIEPGAAMVAGDVAARVNDKRDARGLNSLPAKNFVRAQEGLARKGYISAENFEPEGRTRPPRGWGLSGLRIKLLTGARAAESVAWGAADEAVYATDEAD